MASELQLIGAVGSEGPGHVVAPEAIPDAQRDEFIWAHWCVEDGNRAEETLATDWGFPRETIAHLRSSRQRAGIAQAGERYGFMFAALGLNDSIVPVAVFCDKNTLITASRERVPLMEDLFKTWLVAPETLGRDLPNTLARLLRAMMQDLEPVFERFHDKIDEIEREIFRDTESPPPMSILKERRNILLLRRKIVPMRENAKALARRTEEPLTRETRILFQDLADEATHLVAEIDIGREMLREVMDAELGQNSNELNEVMRRMTVIASVLAVATLVASNYGMNFKHMPELDWPAGYAFAILLMIVASGLTLAVFKWKRYF